LRPSERRSENTLRGTYMFADHGVDTTGKTFAGVGYEVFDGNGNLEGVFSANVNGKINLPVYFLHNRRRANKIQVVRLKEYLEDRLNIEFHAQA
jgi:hypothetical protein